VTALTLDPQDTIAVINDDSDEADVWNLLIAEAGYRPVIIHRPTTGPYNNPQSLVERIESTAKWAICDHRLNLKGGGFAQFFGAEAVAKLNHRRHTPALLVTEYDQIDADVSIRLYRKEVPVLVPAQSFDSPEVLSSALRACAAEVIEGKVPMHRRPWRTLIEISNRTTESDREVLDALIPGWKPRVQIRFPLELIGEQLRSTAQAESRFFAKVNTGAEGAEDLFLYDFEAAPEPIEEGFIA
jgi:hypothetical protein